MAKGGSGDLDQDVSAKESVAGGVTLWFDLGDQDSLSTKPKGAFEIFCEFLHFHSILSLGGAVQRNGLGLKHGCGDHDGTASSQGQHHGVTGACIDLQGLRLGVQEDEGIEDVIPDFGDPHLYGACL